jgi:hypothetical protein
MKVPHFVSSGHTRTKSPRNENSQSVVSDTPKVSNHCLHHEWQQLTAITPHRLDELSTEVVVMCVISLLKLSEKEFYKNLSTFQKQVIISLAFQRHR